jgi:hypothetical protein
MPHAQTSGYLGKGKKQPRARISAKQKGRAFARPLEKSIEIVGNSAFAAKQSKNAESAEKEHRRLGDSIHKL